MKRLIFIAFAVILLGVGQGHWKVAWPDQPRKVYSLSDWQSCTTQWGNCLLAAGVYNATSTVVLNPNPPLSGSYRYLACEPGAIINSSSDPAVEIQAGYENAIRMDDCEIYAIGVTALTVVPSPTWGGRFEMNNVRLNGGGNSFLDAAAAHTSSTTTQITRSSGNWPSGVLYGAYLLLGAGCVNAEAQGQWSYVKSVDDADTLTVNDAFSVEPDSCGILIYSGDTFYLQGGHALIEESIIEGGAYINAAGGGGNIRVQGSWIHSSFSTRPCYSLRSDDYISLGGVTHGNVPECLGPIELNAPRVFIDGLVWGGDPISFGAHRRNSSDVLHIGSGHYFGAQSPIRLWYGADVTGTFAMSGDFSGTYDLIDGPTTTEVGASRRIDLRVMGDSDIDGWAIDDILSGDFPLGAGGNEPAAGCIWTPTNQFTITNGVASIASCW